MKGTQFLLFLAAFGFPGAFAAEDATALVASLPTCGVSPRYPIYRSAIN